MALKGDGLLAKIKLLGGKATPIRVNPIVRTYLDIPFSEKEQARSLGAKFDSARKQWYCPDGIDLRLFARWLPPELSRYWRKVKGARFAK